MKMTQAEWAKRVQAIGALAGWNEEFMRPHKKMKFPLTDLAWMENGAPSPAVIAAVRQLALDWLIAEGVRPTAPIPEVAP